jgi:hypothetical protein
MAKKGKMSGEGAAQSSKEQEAASEPVPIKSFLAALATDPARLGAYIRDPDGELAAAGIAEADRAILKSGDAPAIHARLSLEAAGGPQAAAAQPAALLIVDVVAAGAAESDPTARSNVAAPGLQRLSLSITAPTIALTVPNITLPVTVPPVAITVPTVTPPVAVIVPNITLPVTVPPPIIPPIAITVPTVMPPVTVTPPIPSPDTTPPPLYPYPQVPSPQGYPYPYGHPCPYPYSYPYPIPPMTQMWQQPCWPSPCVHRCCCPHMGPPPHYAPCRW